jgi:HEAT repeat protein
LFFGRKRPEDEIVKELRGPLREGDVRKRLSSIPSIVEAGSKSPQIFPILIKDGDVRVRSSAAFAVSATISSSRDLREDLIGQLVEFFMHKDLRMQYYAAGLLGRVASEHPEALQKSMPRILALLKEKELSLYVYPRAFAVGNIGIESPRLVEGQLSDLAPLLGEQKEITIALERISSRSPQLVKDCVPQLVEILKGASQETFSICWDTAVILARISVNTPELGQLVGGHMENLLQGEEVFTRAFSTYVIGELGLRSPSVVTGILPKLMERLDDEPDVRWFATLALGRIGAKSKIIAERVSQLLLERLQDDEPLVRGAATVSLRYISLSSPELVKNILPSLSEMLKDKHPTIRGIAAIGLKLISLVTSDLVSDVAGALADATPEENSDARRGAATAFHHVSRFYEPSIDKALVPQIAELLGDKEPRIRDRALMAVKNIAVSCPDDVKDSIPRVYELLGDKEANIRRDAAYALYEFAEKYPGPIKELALVKLVEMLEDKDIHVQSFAALTLGRLL